MARITDIDGQDILTTDIEIDGEDWESLDHKELGKELLRRGVTIEQLLGRIKKLSDNWDEDLEKQLPVEVALKVPGPSKFVVTKEFDAGPVNIPVDKILALALDCSYDPGYSEDFNADDFLELIETIIG